MGMMEKLDVQADLAREYLTAWAMKSTASTS